MDFHGSRWDLFHRRMSHQVWRRTNVHSWIIVRLFQCKKDERFMLRQAHLMNLESNTAMYDFVGMLRRLTDNAFAQETSVGLSILLSEEN